MSHLKVKKPNYLAIFNIRDCFVSSSN